MTNVINLPPDTRGSSAGEGLGGLLNAFLATKKKEEQDQETKDYIASLIQTKQAEDERALTTGKQADPNAGMLVPAPKHLDITTRVGLVNQVFKPPAKKDIEELIPLFKPPAVKGDLPEQAGNITKGQPQPQGLYTREQIASFLQFPSEGKQPTEKELALGSELRTFKDAFKGVDKQTATDRVRLYQSGENDLQAHLTQAFGVYNKDTNKYEIQQPELVRKAIKIQREVKRAMYSGEVKDWQEGLSQAYDKFGVEPPMKPEPPAPAKKKDAGGILGLIDRLRGKTSAESDTTQSAPQAPKPAGQAEESVSIGAANGQDIKVPTSVKGAKAIHEYIVQTYKLDPETARRMILRYGSQ
jgi:hypothetical protein